LRVPPAAAAASARDDRAGAERVAVISHAYWRRRFGDPRRLSASRYASTPSHSPSSRIRRAF
jgi:hypothetical protein